MKKSLFFLTVSLVAAFLVITMVRWRSSPGTQTETNLGEAEKQRIRNFWDLYNKANALRIAARFAEAVPAYRKCLELNPKHEDSLYYLGTSLYELGEYSEAAATLRRMIELNPSSSRALSQLGNTLSLLAPGSAVNFEEAREAYQRSTQVNREEAGPFLRLGFVGLNQGKLDAALEHFRIAAGFGSPEGNFWVGYTLFLENRLEEATRFFRKALDSYARERKVTARGVLSEGDVLPAPGKPLSLLEKTGLKSMLFLYWTAQKSGGYPSGFPKEFYVHNRPDDRSPFRLASSRMGLDATGGRAAWTDFDGDGHPDVVVVGLGHPLVLYRNEGGAFVDATRPAGLAGVRDVWDAVWADYDGDGRPDLYLVRSGFIGAGQNLLYHNNGHGKFTDVTASVGLAGERSTARAFWFDFDGDGRLDLLEVGKAVASHSAARLFRNTGGRFVEWTGRAGLESAPTAVDCAIGDYDHDGKPDLFVLNWRREAVLYHNDGHGTFSDTTAVAGLKGVGGQGFSALFFDYDKDGWADLLVTTHAPFEEAVRSLLQPDLRAPRNTPRLFRNKGNGSFEEVTEKTGLHRCYGTMQAIAADFDSDGWTDLLLVNGSLDAQRLEPSAVLRNLGGEEFREWCYLPDFGRPANFIGATVVDLNRHGALHVFLVPNPILRSEGKSGGLYVNTVATRRDSPPRHLAAR